MTITDKAIKVYGVPISPFVRKVWVAAAEKGIAIEMAHGNTNDPSPEFAAASPFRKIPAIEDGDFRLADSSAILTYFEAKVPHPALLPLDPQARAKAIWFEEYADTIILAAAGKVVFNRVIAPMFVGIPGDEAAALQGIADLGPVLDYLECAAPPSGYLVGDFSVGDIAVASMLASLDYARFSLDPARWPKAADWYDRVKQRPCWIDVTKREKAAMAAFSK